MKGLTETQIATELVEDYRAHTTKAFKKYRIGKSRGKNKTTGKLKSTLDARVLMNGQQVKGMRMEYMSYGKYVDMGAGPGSNSDGAKLGRLKAKRKKKPWNSKAIKRMQLRYAERTAQLYGYTATQLLERIPQVVEG